MGCGTSTQIHVQAPQKLNETEMPVKVAEETPPGQNQDKPQQVKEPAKQKQPITYEVKEFRKQKAKIERKPFCYLFGETNEERKIICFNAKQYGFSTISSRNKIPSPPLKYQPIEVIYEQSQQLFSSNLFSSNSHPPYNFMLVLWLDKEKIFLCGGVNYDFDHISSEAFLFDSSSEPNVGNTRKLGNNLMGTRFQKLPFMHRRRYSHMGVVMTIESLKYVLIFGGRSQNDEVINECQKYSLTEKKWKKISPMKVPRSTGFTLIFKSKVYVFGGYSGKSKRSKKIEAYTPAKDYWEVLDIKLHRGIETGLLFSVKPNEVLIMGGNLECGSVKSVVRLNLEESTYVHDSQMKREKVLQKGIQTDSDIVVFGGDFYDGLEIYNVKEKRWYPSELFRRQNSTSYVSHISSEDINSFSFSAETINVESEEVQQPKKEEFTDERVCLFSNDETPCIIDINLSRFNCKMKAVPMSLRLRSHMGSVLVKPGKHFICGGVNQYYEKASRATFFYYASTNNCVEQTKMMEPRYSFGCCMLDNYVYVFGGKKSESQILNSCERFNIEANTWEKLPNLEKARHSLMAIPFKNKIYIIGGINDLMCVDQVEVYNPSDNKITTTDMCYTLRNGIPIQHDGQIYVVGGHDNLGENFFLLHFRLEEKEAKTELVVDRLDETDRVQQATSSSCGIVLFNSTRANIWHDKKIEDKIFMNQIKMSGLDLTKAVMS